MGCRGIASIELDPGASRVGDLSGLAKDEHAKGESLFTQDSSGEPSGVFVERAHGSVRAVGLEIDLSGPQES